MDLLRFIVRLPVLLFDFLWRVLAWLVRRLFGDFSWQAPTWLRVTDGAALNLGASMARHRLRYVAGVLALGIVFGAGWFGWHWYENRPRPAQPQLPPLITYRVTAPTLTEYDASPIVVRALSLRFSGSAAPIAMVGKSAGAGIVIDPEIAGTWTWDSDKQLTFQPKEDWPIDQKYVVNLDPARVFAEHVRIEQRRFDFASAPFEAKLASSEFYQDPQDAALKKAVINLHFSHPVNTVDLEKRIALNLRDRVQISKDKIEEKSQPKKFVINYDERKLNAFIHSEPLAIPIIGGALDMHIAAGVHAQKGGNATTAEILADVTLPTLYSLSVSGISATLVDNTHYEPEQVLVMETSQAINEADASKSISAYVLPVMCPATQQPAPDVPCSWSTDTVSEKMLKKSQKLTLESVPTEREFAELHSFKYHADPGDRVFVQVEKGIKSFGGYLLANRVTEIVDVPDYPRVLKFMADGALLSFSGERRVAVVARNVPGMQVEIARVLPDQLQHLVSLNQSDRYDHPDLGSFGSDRITERFVQKLEFGQQEPRKAHYEGVDLGKYLGSAMQGKRGVFLLSLKSYSKADDKPVPAPDADVNDGDASEENNVHADAENEGDDRSGADSDKVGDKRLIVVTDLGVLVKKSIDGTQDIYVQSIHSGEPVADAHVDVVGKNGQTILSETTDHDGHVHFTTLDAYTREKAAAMYLVRKGEDLSFLPVGSRDRKLDYSRFDIGGLRSAKDGGELTAYLFSDRGIYRPGDSFHIGMIARAADWKTTLDGIPLEAEIVDPRGVTVERHKLRLGAAGFEELSYTTQENAPTGAWTVNLYITKEKDGNQTQKQLGSVAVQVKEFMPDRMKVDAHLSQQVVEGWVKPDDLKALVSVQNLFGTPAQDRRVEASLTLTPAFPAFRSYRQYHFFDPQRAKEGYTEPLGTATTNEKGEAEFPLDLGKYGTASYQLYFLAKAFEAEGGRSVAAEAVSLVSSQDYLIGSKADGNLEFIARGAKVDTNLIGIDPHAKKIAVDGLKAVLVERRYVSILTKQDSGVFKYESRMKEVPVSDQPLAIPAAGLDYTLATDKPGNYSLLIKNAHGDEMNRIDYAVAGEANLTRSLERNAELQLTLSKTDYAPGEDIEIAVRAPYAGSGLITIERDHVYASAWFKAGTSSSVQKIRVPANFEGNGYINVQFIRDPTSDEVFMSPLSYGVVPFSVNRDARRNAITISTPNLVKPGEPLNIKLTSAQPARVVVFAIDEGILQVARYKLGDPLEFFFRKRMLEVQTAQILDLILPDFNKLVGMAAAPGGDGDNMLGRHLNPFKRKHQQPVAYWSGIVDVKGEKTLTYQVPDDFNGRLRVMAVSVAPDKIGTFETSTTVRGDFVLSPNVPAIVAPGDEFEISIGVANNLTGLAGKELPISVALNLPAQLEAVGAAIQEVKLGEMKEGVVVFRLRAKNKPGALEFSVSASAQGKSAKLGLGLSLRPAAPYRTEIQVGQLDRGRADIDHLRSMFDDYAKRDISASYVPLVLARGLAAYLDSFPYLCTEQLVSRAMPALVFDKHPEFGTVVKTDNKNKGTDPFRALLAVLRSRQNSEGGFGLWTATPVSHRYASIYAMHYLIEAKERGQLVPADMLAAGNTYLSQVAADESANNLWDLRDRTHAIYLLTRQGNVTTNYLAAVQQHLERAYGRAWHDDLAAAYLAASFQLLKQDKEAAALIGGPQQQFEHRAVDAKYQFAYYYDPLIADASTLYLLAKHFPERAKKLPAAAIQNIVRPLQKGYYNTLSSAMTIAALDAYATLAIAGDGKLALLEVHQDGTSPNIGTPKGIVLSGTFSAAANALRIVNDADLTAWYSVAQSGFDQAPPDKEIKDGFEIVREYTTTDGKALDKVTLGQEIDVHLKIRRTLGEDVSNLAIVDLLPGGFEPVLSLPPTADEAAAADTAHSDSEDASKQPAWRAPVGLASSTLNPEYVDVRDDRVVVYASASSDVREFVYRIKATNAGTYIVPPAYGESMYDRTVQARSLGSKLNVERK